MKTRIKPVLSRKEASAYEGLLSLSAAHDLHVFPKMKLADAIEFDNTSLNSEELFYAERTRFDFVLASKDYTSVLAIDVDFVDRHFGAEEEVKDRICAELPIGHVRIDCSMMAAYQVAEFMHVLVDDFNASWNESTVLTSFEYSGCLLHPQFCDLEICREFESVCQHLFSIHNVAPFHFPSDAPRVSCRTTDSGAYCETVISISVNGTEQVLANGRCRVSAQVHTLGRRLSMHLAASIASREIEDVRNHIFGTDEPCSLDLKFPLILDSTLAVTHFPVSQTAAVL